MKLSLSRQQYDQLLRWADEFWENECCGLMLGREDVVEALELAKNVSQRMTAEFEIDPSALIAAERAARNRGPQILGYFHSHPNGLEVPSLTDSEMAADDGRVWLIVTTKTVTAWRTVAGSDVAGRFEWVELIIEG